jgi:hypothetical protein
MMHDKQVVYYLLSVKLIDEVPMLERDRKKAAEWLKTWNPKTQVRAALAASQNDAVAAFREDFFKVLHELGYPEKNFEFTIGCHEPTVEDGVLRFVHDCALASVVGYCVSASSR